MKAGQEVQEPRHRTGRFAFAPSSWDWGSIVCHLSFVGFGLALLWRPLFAGEAFFWGTPLLQFIPWQQLAADMWRSGHLPLWNPLVGCGAPLAANYQTAAFYPLNALHLLVQSDVALTWTVALHLVLAGWGMYRWARSIGLERLPAFMAGVTLEGSGFLVARAALFPSIVLTFPWLAIWLWRAEVLIQATRFRDAIWLGVALGLGLLAGHAQTAFYGGLLLTAYLTLRTIQRAKEQAPEPGNEQHTSPFTCYALRLTPYVLCLSLISLTVGVGLAAVQLLPTAELLMHSHRSSGISSDFAMTYSFWPWRLITFAAPNFFGSPGQGNYWGYATYWEDAAYVGVLPLLLALAAVCSVIGNDRRPTKERISVAGLAPRTRYGPADAIQSQVYFWASAALIALVLALGKNTPIFPFLFRHVPSFDLFQAPARWLAITTVALAALAAIGAHHWPRGRRARRRGALGVTIGASLLIAGLTAPRLFSDMPTTFGPATARLGGSLIVAGALTLFRARRSVRSIWWSVAIGLFIALDLLTVGWPLIPTVNRSLYDGPSAPAAVLQSHGNPIRVYWPTDPDYGQNRAHYRVKFDYLTFDDFGPHDVSYWRGMRNAQLPNVGMLDGVPSANNFDPLLVDRYVDVLGVAAESPDVLRTVGVTHVASDRPWSGGEPIHSQGAVTFYRLPNPLGRAWVVPEARRVAPDVMMEALTDPRFDPSAQVLLAVDPPLQHDGSLSSTPSQIVSLQDAPNGVTIATSLETPGYLVLADTWYPGWQVTVDGEPDQILRANHAFRAVALDRGIHIVEMRYRPFSVRLGRGVSFVTVAVVILAYLACERLSRDRRATR